ncbi:hypothetical protein PM076_02545 [Halorubrum ezzemoulense]|uniref:Uncharacterized protein n=1 Tax=Halorubrum ezzemoulense TaxID=337243 RepID=A0ABT4Z418_HALEZ|nr:hypothetical protein [Halorubrum ezzemoulense]MDB2244690.1 hypothetical protein [Halorubrum ezzemoulense]MDB2250897.1 hypothetical protein [Halorubrum ezzemoulense]MDB2278553.1 hypothetical protein [Halorubrum ezzemoulense]MDB2285227.1 hypothetical protein [Halorubrum ezzemoulense]MDB2288024.1 hypothetical protein [Halorubrum ezzemoulense]
MAVALLGVEAGTDAGAASDGDRVTVDRGTETRGAADRERDVPVRDAGEQADAGETADAGANSEADGPDADGFEFGDDLADPHAGDTGGDADGRRDGRD